MTRIFLGKASDLDEALAYEMNALDHLRENLFDKPEDSNDCLTITLGDFTEEGKQIKHRSLHLHDDTSAEAVKAALSKLRPLAFSAAFKMQDMIVEWILRANGHDKWRFSEKLKKYDQLSATASLVLPDFFEQRPLVGKAFWEIYRFFEPYRGTVTHAGGIVITGNGTLQISKPGKPTLNLSSEELGAYIQALCIVARTLVEDVALKPQLDAVVENSLADLASYHGVGGLKSRHIREAKLKIKVPQGQVVSECPLSVKLDWDGLRTMMREHFASGIQDAEVFFPVTVEVQRDAAISSWQLPLEVVPVGQFTLTEGDPRFDPYLTHQTST